MQCNLISQKHHVIAMKPMIYAVDFLFFFFRRRNIEASVMGMVEYAGPTVEAFLLGLEEGGHPSSRWKATIQLALNLFAGGS